MDNKFIKFYFSIAILLRTIPYCTMKTTRDIRQNSARVFRATVTIWIKKYRPAGRRLLYRICRHIDILFIIVIMALALPVLNIYSKWPNLCAARLQDRRNKKLINTVSWVQIRCFGHIWKILLVWSCALCCMLYSLILREHTTSNSQMTRDGHKNVYGLWG